MCYAAEARRTVASATPVPGLLNLPRNQIDALDARDGARHAWRHARQIVDRLPKLNHPDSKACVQAFRISLSYAAILICMNARPHYGFDLPAVALGSTMAAAALLALTALVAATTGGLWWLFPLGYALVFALSCASICYTARRGRFTVWRRLLDGVRLTGGESIVDLGCGHGAVLMLAARKVPHGHAIGVDGKSRLNRTFANAKAEQVNVDLISAADLGELPIETGTVDLVVSSLALHRIGKDAARAKVIAEAVRILRPGGRVLIADRRFVPAYASQLAELRLNNVIVTDLGWRFWHGGPWAHTYAVTARR